VPTRGHPVRLLGYGVALANAEIINIHAGIFVPIAMGTGALGMLVGGLWEFRDGNLMGAAFATANACFLFTTALMLRWFAPEIRRARFRQPSNSLASEPRDAWTSSKALATRAAARRTLLARSDSQHRTGETAPARPTGQTFGVVQWAPKVQSRRSPSSRGAEGWDSNPRIRKTSVSGFQFSATSCWERSTRRRSPSG
jgi:GPR1/FUN34/yaaH family